MFKRSAFHVMAVVIAVARRYAGTVTTRRPSALIQAPPAASRQPPRGIVQSVPARSSTGTACRCHNDRRKTGSLWLQNLDASAPGTRTPEIWENVLRKLRS